MSEFIGEIYQWERPDRTMFAKGLDVRRVEDSSQYRLRQTYVDYKYIDLDNNYAGIVEDENMSSFKDSFKLIYLKGGGNDYLMYKYGMTFEEMFRKLDRGEDLSHLTDSYKRGRRRTKRENYRRKRLREYHQDPRKYLEIMDRLEEFKNDLYERYADIIPDLYELILRQDFADAEVEDELLDFYDHVEEAMQEVQNVLQDYNLLGREDTEMDYIIDILRDEME